MFKSIINWLTAAQPVHNWIILVLLLCFIVNIGFILNEIRKRTERDTTYEK